MSVSSKAKSVCFSVKGQVVIPKRLRKEFEIEAGTRAHIEATAEGILITPITAKSIRGLRGKYKHLPIMETLRDIKREDKER